MPPNCRGDDLQPYTYDLPEELIAQEPLPVRHSSRLLYLRRASGKIAHFCFADLPKLLNPGDVLVVNDTRVLPVRLLARRATGGAVEILLLRPEASAGNLWQAMATPIKKLKVGEALGLEPAGSSKRSISVAGIVTADDGQKRLLLDLGSPADVYSLLSERGYAPLPPYIHRVGGESRRLLDLDSYQTIFARKPGAVAAPTAGLHFSQAVMEELREHGIEICSVTLHVGPGTFKPITTSVVAHSIEPESFSIPRETTALVNTALSEGRRVVAVGTTSCRALETAGATGRLESVHKRETSLYIRPGHKFQIVTGLITNFHLSRSSLLVLVSTFAGQDLTMKAYQEAITHRYRFFSYGDAMLIL